MRTPLQKDEKVLLINYTSWLSLVIPFLLAVAGIVAAYYIDNSTWRIIAPLVGLLIFLFKYAEWKVDIWVVTSSRVIDESGLFSHFAKESPLDKINNVSYDQTIWGRLFNFGHVQIQTAAEVGATEYYDVGSPKRLKDTITLAQAQYKNGQLTSQAREMATAMGFHKQSNELSSTNSIATELEKLVSLRQKGILSEDEFNRAKAKILNS